MEIKQFEDKLTELNRICYEVKAQISECFNEIKVLKNSGDEHEKRADIAKKEYELTCKRIGDYSQEFEEKKKTEIARLEEEKRKTREDREDAERKLNELSKKLDEVNAKEKSLDGKLKEIEILKSELSAQKENIKNFAQKFG